MEEIRLGIEPVDDLEHVVVGRFKPTIEIDNPAGYEVIEMANLRLPHTKVKGGDPRGRIAVFTRLISRQELAIRTVEYEKDPEAFMKQNAQNLNKQA